ncbi:hypothetical protein ZIOFF_008919 [Zingiber officinale]|uniref:Uncharacterized protein n=1 Tax=Zingiber officinale TaxID=94328 RepID=A0A8J5LXK4_ZINOF|nr:hypothetical protein ZIOFF_008919 [Zingiber officinale]
MLVRFINFRCGGAIAPAIVQKLMRKLTRKLMRKVKRKSHVLCMTTTTRPAAFQRQYDPLSYSKNFEPTFDQLDDDFQHFNHTFSSRFAPAAASAWSSCDKQRDVHVVQ